jgi:two-component system KDP operon response regulator KdpE
MINKLPKILIVDDEPQILRFLRASLPPHGYECVEATTQSEAIKAFAKEKPDALILDLGLPDKDGEGKVKALELGADDYVTKPFDMAELLARLKAALRHGLQAIGEAPVFRSGALSVDLVNRRVKLGDKEVHLSPKEYGLLRYLAGNAGKVVTHQQLLREIWGPAHLDDFQYLRVLMRQLRQKLEPDTTGLIITEPGIGYRLVILPDGSPAEIP